MTFFFGIIVGALITIGATNPEWLGGALHWAGDKVQEQEAIEIPIPTGEDEIRG